MRGLLLYAHFGPNFSCLLAAEVCNNSEARWPFIILSFSTVMSRWMHLACAARSAPCIPQIGISWVKTLSGSLQHFEYKTWPLTLLAYSLTIVITASAKGTTCCTPLPRTITHDTGFSGTKVLEWSILLALHVLKLHRGHRI